MDTGKLKNKYPDLGAIDAIFTDQANPRDRCKKNQKSHILNATENCKDEFDIRKENGSFYLTRTYWSKQNKTELSEFCLQDIDVAMYLFCVEETPPDAKFK